MRHLLRRIAVALPMMASAVYIFNKKAEYNRAPAPATALATMPPSKPVPAPQPNYNWQWNNRVFRPIPVKWMKPIETKAQYTFSQFKRFYFGVTHLETQRMVFLFLAHAWWCPERVPVLTRMDLRCALQLVYADVQGDFHTDQTWAKIESECV